MRKAGIAGRGSVVSLVGMIALMLARVAASQTPESVGNVAEECRFAVHLSHSGAQAGDHR